MGNKLTTFAVAMALALGMTACEDETPSQKTSDAGRSAGQAVNDVTKATDEHLPQSKAAAGPETLNGIERKTMSIFAVVAAVAVLSTAVLGASPETKKAATENEQGKGYGRRDDEESEARVKRTTEPGEPSSVGFAVKAAEDMDKQVMEKRN
jgi:hypothetical protein